MLLHRHRSEWATNSRQLRAKFTNCAKRFRGHVSAGRFRRGCRGTRRYHFIFSFDRIGFTAGLVASTLPAVAGFVNFTLVFLSGITGSSAPTKMRCGVRRGGTANLRVALNALVREFRL